MGKLNHAARPFAVALLVGAVALLGLGGYLAWEAHRFTAGAARAEGTVVELVGRENVQGRARQYAPVVGYQVAGKSYRLHTDRFAYPARFAVGDKVEIAYQPDAPGDARLGGFRQTYTTAILVGVGALALALMGAILLRATRPRTYQTS